MTSPTGPLDRPSVRPATAPLPAPPPPPAPPEAPAPSPAPPPPAVARDKNQTAKLDPEVAAQALEKKQEMPAFSDDSHHAPEKHEEPDFFHKVAGAVVRSLGHDVGEFAQETAKAANKVVDKLADTTKVLAKAETELTASVLDAAGDHQDAAKVRASTKAVDQVIDHEKKQLEDHLKNSADNVQKTATDVSSVTASFVEGGAEKAVEDLAQRSLGDQKEAYKNQIDGITGSIANRLGPGESASISAVVSVNLPSETVATVLTLGAGGESIPDLGASLDVKESLKREDDGMLSLTVSATVKERAGYSTGAGSTLKATVFNTTAGFSADMSASVGVEASQSASITLKFDPKKPEDVARLKAITESKTTAESQKAFMEAAKKNMDAVEVGGGFRQMAEAHVKATLDTGNTPESATGVKAGVTEDAGVTTSLRVDKDNNYTASIAIDGKLSASLSANGESLEAGNQRLEGRLSVTTKGPTGPITSASLELTRETGEGKTETIRKTLTEEATKAFYDRVKAGEDKVEAFKAVMSAPGAVKNERVEKTSDNYTIFSFEVSGKPVFGKSEVGINLSMSKSKEKTVAISSEEASFADMTKKAFVDGTKYTNSVAETRKELDEHHKEG